MSINKVVHQIGRRVERRGCTFVTLIAEPLPTMEVYLMAEPLAASREELCTRVAILECADVWLQVGEDMPPAADV